jgi:hypothetical protein
VQRAKADGSYLEYQLGSYLKEIDTLYKQNEKKKCKTTGLIRDPSVLFRTESFVSILPSLKNESYCAVH